MEENRLKITANKLNRLNVHYELNNHTILLRGSSFSKGQFFLTVILPIVVFILFITGLVLYFLAQEAEVILFPKITLVLLLLPLVLLFFGIKNFLRLRKSKKYQIHIMPGKIIVKDKSTDEIVLPVKKIKKISIKIEENKGNCIGEIYVQNLDYESYLLLGVLGNNIKYFKDDLEYIKNTFLMILENFETRTENYGKQEKNPVQTEF